MKGTTLTAHRFYQIMMKKQMGSLGITVVKPRILGCVGAYTPTHPKMRTLPRNYPKTQHMTWINFGKKNGEVLSPF